MQQQPAEPEHQEGEEEDFSDDDEEFTQFVQVYHHKPLATAPPGVLALSAPLPLGSDAFPDEALAVVCRFLDLRALGRLAAVSRRFTEPTLTESTLGGRFTEPVLTENLGATLSGGGKLSPIEEGARLQLVAAAEDLECPFVARLPKETWVRALWRAEFVLVLHSFFQR